MYIFKCFKLSSYTGQYVNIDILATKCPAGQVYQQCGDSCARSCRNLQLGGDTCQPKCVAGCGCPRGKTLGAGSVCIDLEACPCLHQGKEFSQGATRVTGDNDKPRVWYGNVASLLCMINIQNRRYLCFKYVKIKQIKMK